MNSSDHFSPTNQYLIRDEWKVYFETEVPQCPASAMFFSFVTNSMCIRRDHIGMHTAKSNKKTCNDWHVGLIVSLST